jgi:hypothetical protein
MCEKAVRSSVKSLEWIYGVVLALAISEAFLQFASDPESKIPGIQWDRFLSLCSFLLLVIPFCHGMSRYFCEIYDREQGDPHYGNWLLIDCAAFTVEAGLFFILARSLANNVWLQFAFVVVVLLVWDVLWGRLVWKFRTNIISFWVIVNLCTLPLFGVVLLFFRTISPWWGVSLTFLLILARTVADYWRGWEFYFPK